MNKIASISLAVCLLCGCNRASSPYFDTDSTQNDLHTIAYLKSLGRGTSTPIRQAITVRGTVTANDRYGEFYKTIVIEDQSGGIEIAIDHTALGDIFPVNAQVTVYCNGLSLGDYGNKLLLGATPTSEYSVDRIALANINRYIRMVDIEPTSYTPAIIDISNVNSNYIDRYVRFENVRFLEAGEQWCETDPITGKLITTNRTIEDSQGARFVVRILDSSIYATEPIPQGTGSVNGIIDYFNGEYSLRISNFRVDFVD